MMRLYHQRCIHPNQILDDFDHHQNYTAFDETNLAYLRRHKPCSLTISTPYELLILKLSFKTEKTLLILTQDISKDR
jgi:hypothetical protein